jgi:hypothetical protein
MRFAWKRIQRELVDYPLSKFEEKVTKSNENKENAVKKGQVPPLDVKEVNTATTIAKPTSGQTSTAKTIIPTTQQQRPSAEEIVQKMVTEQQKVGQAVVANIKSVVNTSPYKPPTIAPSEISDDISPRLPSQSTSPIVNPPKLVPRIPVKKTSDSSLESNDTPGSMKFPSEHEPHDDVEVPQHVSDLLGRIELLAVQSPGKINESPLQGEPGESPYKYSKYTNEIDIEELSDQDSSLEDIR